MWAEKVIRVGVTPSSPPFCFIDVEGGGLRGFAVDLAKMLSVTMGARAKFVAEEKDELRRLLGGGKVDVIIAERSEIDPFIQALELPVHVERKLFVNKNCMTVVCTRDLPGRTVVTVKGHDVVRLIPQPEKVKLLEVDSQETALQLVDEGRVDAYLSANGLSSVYLIQKGNLKNVKEIGIPVERVPMAILVPQWNTALLTQLSVAFGKIVENKSYDTIYRKWFGRSVLSSGVEKYYRVLLGSLGLLGMTVLGFLVYNQMLKRKVRRVTYDLSLSEQKYQRLVEYAPDMIHLIAADGSILHANRMALNILDFGLEDLRGVKIWDLVHPDQRGEMQEFMQNVFHVGQGKKEFVMRARNGREVYVETSAVVVAEADNMIACLFSRDLSDHRRLEAELIQRERLALMGEMAAGVAHEINNPLGIILASAEEMLEQGNDLENWKENLQAIERNALRASKFIEDLLSFTRPSPPSKVQFDLVYLINECLVLCKQHLKKKRIEINKDFPEGPVFMEGDYNQIQQVIVNVLLNSIQAIEEEGTIRIQVRQEGTGSVGKVHVEISDTGVGITEKDLPRIFDPFFTARKNKGFGLGLSISKRIVEKHGGRIQVTSKVGKGTTVSIEFPDSLKERLTMQGS